MKPLLLFASSSFLFVFAAYGCSGESDSGGTGGSSGHSSGGASGGNGGVGGAHGGSAAGGKAALGGSNASGAAGESTSGGSSPHSSAGAAGEPAGGTVGAAGASGAAGSSNAAGSGGAGGAGGADVGSAGAAGETGCAPVTQIGAAAAATSCLALLSANSSLSDGTYQLDLDGNGPFPSLPYYCDMTNGGWTLVANQVPGSPLPDSVCTVNPGGFGTTTQSYRLGVPDITKIVPTVSWKLTDPTHAVYIKPTCVVDWTINYNSLDAVATVCTTGYTTTTFDTVVNGRWTRASVRGIGINNNGAVCSMRMYESHMQTDGTIEPSSLQAGVACPCDYQQYTTQRVSLWFL